MLPLQVQQCLNDGLAVTLVVMYGYAPGGDGESAGHWVVLHKAGQGEHATVVVDDHEGHAQAAVVAALALERGGVWRTLCGSPRLWIMRRRMRLKIMRTRMLSWGLQLIQCQWWMLGRLVVLQGRRLLMD